MKSTQQQAHVQAIITKCWKDEAFKQQLMASPQATIEEFIGQPIRLPEGVKLVVNDQSDPSLAHFNIPVEPNLEDVELNEEQMEAVAGGHIPIIPYIDWDTILKPPIPDSQS